VGEKRGCPSLLRPHPPLPSFTYSSQVDDVSVTCPGSSTTPLAEADVHKGCPAWAGNSAAYGPTACTTAFAVTLSSGAVVEKYLSNSVMEVIIAVQDAYHQVCMHA
jgi:hypothetical protein